MGFPFDPNESSRTTGPDASQIGVSMRNDDSHKLNLAVVPVVCTESNPPRWFAIVTDADADRELHQTRYFPTEAAAVAAGESWAEEHRNENELRPLVGGGYRDPRTGEVIH